MLVKNAFYVSLAQHESHLVWFARNVFMYNINKKGKQKIDC